MALQPLADASDLALWADRRDAQARLSELVRRLILATAKVERLDNFRSGEGVNLPGWDGTVEAEKGTPFVPVGVSSWELGVSAKPGSKANSDYRKRSEEPEGLVQIETTFVFVTARRWQSKDSWVQKKRAEKVWRDVRAYDADDLATWLEQTPAVHLWISSLLGKHAEGAEALSDFWTTWISATEPELSPRLLLAGRQTEAARLAQWLAGPPGMLSVQADTVNEAVAFLCAAMLDEAKIREKERQTEENVEAESPGAPAFARAIVVSDPRAWAQYATSTAPLLLIPTFADRSVIAGAPSHGHHVLIPMGLNEPASVEVRLSRLHREAARDALVELGVSQEKVSRLALVAHQSLNALRRHLAVDKSLMHPLWAAPQEARALIPALLAGRWSDTNDADREILSSLAGRDYSTVREELVRWAFESDPPVRLVGNVWLVSSRDDSWSVLSRYITGEEVDRLDQAVQAVLGQADPKWDLPPGDRWLAQIHGKRPEHSEHLRAGLSETLLLLGAYSDQCALAATNSGQGYASGIVGLLLREATTWQMWASLAPHLATLAEAAPNEVLRAVDRAVSSTESPLELLFREPAKDPLDLGPQLGLLGALEVLAWKSDYLSQVVVTLAELAGLCKSGTQALSRLLQIFSAWSSRAAGSDGSWLEIIDLVRQRQPAVVWSVLMALVPRRISQPLILHLRKPTRRAWAVESSFETSLDEVVVLCREFTPRLLAEAATNGNRWQVLVQQLAVLPISLADEAARRLRELSLESAFDTEERVLVWSALGALLEQQRHCDPAWRLPVEQLQALSEARKALAPTSIIQSLLPLFSANPSLPNASHQDEESEMALAKVRSEGVQHLYETGGLAGVLKLAEQAELPGIIGSLLAENQLVAELELPEFLSTCLGANAEAHRVLGHQFLRARARPEGLHWLESLTQWPAWKTWNAGQRANYFCSLPFSLTTWQKMETEAEEVHKLYWTQQRGLSPQDLPEDSCWIVIEEFLRFVGPAPAVSFMAACIRQEKKPATQLVEKLLASSDIRELPEALQSYSLRELVDYLRACDEMDNKRMAQVEARWFPVFGQRSLNHLLAQEPPVFADYLATAYGLGDQGKEKSLQVLLRWNLPPGLMEDGSVRTGELSNWVDKSLALAGVRGLCELAAYRIGETLSFLPGDLEDEIWPHRALRDLLETQKNLDLEEGLRIGIRKRRRAPKKTADEAGDQERDLAEHYRTTSRALSLRWPRMAQILRDVAEAYDRDARREEDEADIRSNLQRWP